MIRINRVSKIYGKNKNEVTALKNVSIDLPDTGMVFIVGKSGSGKSTLLNIIGGLDEATAGQILIDGTDLALMNERQMDSYRNNYIGIIYQNFNLFPNETVYQNIENASLIAQHKVTEKEIDDICEKLDLSEKKRTKVKNMSGGQRQRVAIARALVKNPDMILADEPTGNLDSKTATSIFEILQNISKEKLVIIISHDIQSAEKYADRIITLSDGKKVSDRVRNNDYFEQGEMLELPPDTKLSSEEIASINEKLKGDGIVIGKRKQQYVEFAGKVKAKTKPIRFTKGRSTLRASFRLSKSFFKNTWLSFFVTFIVVVGTLGLLTFAQAFTQFDGKETIKEVTAEYNTKSYVMKKGYSATKNKAQVDMSMLMEVTDKDKQAFLDTGYQGNIYEIYGSSMRISGGEIENSKHPDASAMYSNYYTTEGLGVVVCDMDYLKRVFGEVKVLAGSLYDLENSYKIIVTDYFADSMIATSKVSGMTQYVSKDESDPYQNIVNVKVLSRYTIGAVIYTGYKERYQEVQDMYQTAGLHPEKATSILSVLTSSDIYVQFLDEVNSVLNFGYSVNPNYKDAFINDSEPAYAMGVNALLTTDEGEYASFGPSASVYTNELLTDNNAVLSTTTYNSLFGTSYTTDTLFESGKETYINISFFANGMDMMQDTPKSSCRVKVLGVFAVADGSTTYAYVSKDILDYYLEESIIPYGYVFDNTEEIYTISKVGQSNYYYTSMVVYSPLITVFNTIEIFSLVFRLIAIVLVVVLFIIILSHNLRVVKKNQYRVGVYKGLGYSSSTIAFASLLNLLVLLVAILLGTMAFSYFFVDALNDIMVDSFIMYLGTTMLEKYTLIKFSMPIILGYMGAIAVLALLSTIAPLNYIRNLKPNLILNKVE